MVKSGTAKLPKGQSYPVRPSRLEAALSAAGITIDVYLTRAPGNFFNAGFWPPSPDIPYERVYVQAGSVPAGQAAAARGKAEMESIPALVRWIADIQALDPQSPARRERHSLKFY